MLNTVIYNPTKVHFGKNVVRELPDVLSQYGKKRILLVYGKGSIKQNGIYDQVVHQVLKAGGEIIEYGGIKSNPLIDDIAEAVHIGIREKVELVLAVGGGSVIDSAKVIGIAVADRIEDPWLLMDKSVTPKHKLPLIAVLTLAATGTEMNHIAVIQSNERKLKFGFKSELNFPDHSFLDPSYTFTVRENYTAYGIVDLMAHVLENFIGEGDATLTDRFSLSILNEAVAYGPQLLNNLSDYRLRSKIMWAATNALNGNPGYGKDGGDWISHAIGHAISVLYDTPHGVTLAVVMPAVMKFRVREIEQQLILLGKNVFGVASADEAIESLKSFFRSLNVPVSLNELGFSGEQVDAIKDLINKNKTRGRNYELTDKQRNTIVDLMIS